MAEDKFGLNDDDLSSLLEQLEGLEDLDIDFGDAAALGEMANSVTDAELDELLTNHETDDGDIPDDFGFFSEPKEDGEDDSTAEEQSPEEEADADNDGAEAAEDIPEQAGDEAEFEPDALFEDILPDGFGLSVEDEAEAASEPAPGADSFDIGISDTADSKDAYDYLNELGGISELGDAMPEDIFGGSSEPDGDEASEPSDDSDYPDFTELFQTPEGPEPQDDEDDELFGVAIDEEATSDDDMLMPDFSFNESFTTGGKGDNIISSRRGAREARARAQEEAEDFFDEEGKLITDDGEEPKKPSIFKRAAAVPKALSSKLISKVPAPVRNVASNKIAPAMSKTVSVVTRKRSQRFKMIATAVIMFVILVISSFLLYGQYVKMRTLIEENKVIARNQNNNYNFANWIFTENKKLVNGYEVTLRRLILDEYACAFHFDTILDMNRYFAELRDNNGKYYGINLPLLYQLGEASAEEDSMTLWFEGIDREAESLSLTIWDSETKESVVFDVDMSDYEMLRAKYTESPRGARTTGYDLNAVVEGATFSSSMSTAVYKLEGKDGADITQVTDGGVAPLILENTSRAVAPLLKRPRLYKVNDVVTVGRMDFGPVRNLGNRALLTISGLYTYFDIGETVSAVPLLDTENTDGMSFDLDGSTLVLEGMRKGNGIYVLVFHFEDESGERINGTFDLNLLIRTYTGVEVRIDPVIRSRLEGGDALFEYQAPNSIVDNSRPEEVFIELRSVMLNIEDAEADIQLQQASESAEDANNADVSSFIKSAYNGRLAVKSGTGDSAALNDYFAPGVLQDDGLNRLYEPVTVTQTPEYSVVVSAVARLSRFEFFAVVDESWLGVSGSDRTHMYNSHKLIIEQNGNNYVITSDELID